LNYKLGGLIFDKEGSEGMKKEVIIMCLIVFFLFLGAGSSQMFLIPHLNSMFPYLLSSLILTMAYVFIIPGILLCIFFLQRCLGDKIKLTLGISGYIVFPLSIFLTKEYIILAISSMYWGIAIGVFWITIVSSMLNISSKKEFGINMSMLFFGSGFGTFLGTIMLSFLQKIYGHEFVFLAAAILSMLALFPLRFLTFNVNVKISERIKAKDLLVVSRSKIITFFMFVGYFSYGFVINSISCAISSTLGPSMIGPITSGYFLMSSLLSIYGGKLSDSIGRRKTFIIAFFSMALGLILNSIFFNLITLLILCFLLGFSSNTIPINAYGWIVERTQESSRLSSTGSSFIWDSIAVTASVLFSTFAYELVKSYQLAFLSFGVLSLICGMLSYVLKDDRSMH